MSYTILTLGVGIVLAAHWPGRLNGDSRGMLAGVEGYLPILDQWSATLTWAWQQAHRLVGLGTGGVLALQTTGLTAGIYLVLRSRLTRLAAATCAVLVLLAPPAFGFVSLVGRDAWFVAGCMLATGMGVTAARVRGDRPRAAALAFGVAMAAVAIAARQNAFTAVAPILVALSMVALDMVRERTGRSASARRPVLAATACGLLATGVLAAAGMLAANATQDRALHPEATTYLYDLGYLTLETDRQLVPSMSYAAVATQTTDEVRARWRRTNATSMRVYNPAWNLGGPPPPIEPAASPPDEAERRLSKLLQIQDLQVRWSLSDEEASRIASAWRAAVLRHPIDYLRGRWGLWLVQAGILHTPDMSDIHRTPGYARAGESVPGTYGYRQPAFPGLSARASRYAESLNADPIYRAWIYLLVCVAGLLLALPRFPRAVRVAAALPAAALALQLGLFFMAPATQWRFQLLAVYAAVIATILGARLALDAVPRGDARR